MPVTVTVTASIEVEVPCFVRCHNCDCQFVYERRFQGVGSAEALLVSDGSTKRKAEARARDDLAKMLADVEINDPTPCPQCFHYQKYMFPQVGYARYDGLGWLGDIPLVLGFCGCVAAVGYAIFWQGTALVYAIALGCALVGFCGWCISTYREQLVAQYNPNEERDIAERQRIAHARAKRLEDYFKHQSDRIAVAYHRGQLAAAGHEPPTFDWWLPPVAFIEGANFTVHFSDTEHAVFSVPENAQPGLVVEVKRGPGGPVWFQVRLLEMRVHPGEFDTEPEEL